MKQIITFFLIVNLQICFSQIIYDYTDYANIDESYLVSITDATSISFYNFQETGEGINWDYSDLQASTQRNINYIDPDNSGYQVTWITECVMNGGTIWGCYAQWDEITNLGKQNNDSIVIGNISLSKNTKFYNKNSVVLVLNFEGYEVNAGQLPFKMIVNYDNPDTVYHFPLTYYSTDSSICNYEIDLTEAGVDIIQKKWYKRKYIVEGWGSLTTPYGYFPEVLKLRVEIYHNDTNIFYGTEMPPDQSIDVIYQWFSKDFGIPLLQVEGKVTGFIETYTRAIYIDSLRCLEPKASFVYTPVDIYLNASGTADVYFTNLSQNTDIYLWDFDDGTISTQINPVHTFTTAGTFNVKLKAGNTVCDPILYDSTIVPVIVKDSNLVNANFSYSPLYPCVGDTVYFTNMSLNANQYFWDFGDGTTSTLVNPVHVYSYNNNFLVQLVATNGVSYDTVYQSIEVSAAIIDAGNDTTIDNGDTAYLHASGGPEFVPFVWEYDSTLSCTLCSNPYATPVNTTTYYVSKATNCGTAYDSITVFVNNSGLSFYTPGTPDVFIYPNPANKYFFLNLNIKNPPTYAKIDILNSTGNLYYSRIFLIKTNKSKKKIKLPVFSNDNIYYIKIVTKEYITVRKLIIIKK